MASFKFKHRETLCGVLFFNDLEAHLFKALFKAAWNAPRIIIHNKFKNLNNRTFKELKKLFYDTVIGAFARITD